MAIDWITQAIHEFVSVPCVVDFEKAKVSGATSFSFLSSGEISSGVFFKNEVKQSINRCVFVIHDTLCCIGHAIAALIKRNLSSLKFE